MQFYSHVVGPEIDKSVSKSLLQLFVRNLRPGSLAYTRALPAMVHFICHAANGSASVASHCLLIPAT